MGIGFELVLTYGALQMLTTYLLNLLIRRVCLSEGRPCTVAAGKCVCVAGFTGEDCGFLLNTSLEYVEPYNALCDVRSSNCSIIQLIGSGFVPGLTTCRVQQVTVRYICQL